MCSSDLPNPKPQTPNPKPQTPYIHLSLKQAIAIMSVSGRSINLPGIQRPGSKASSKGEESYGPVRKRANQVPILNRGQSNVESLMHHRREKGELPSLLNRSVRVEPEIRKDSRVKLDMSADAKPNQKVIGQAINNVSNQSSMSRELNNVGVSRVENKADESSMLRAIVEQKEKDRVLNNQELDDKMGLWNNIISQRKKLYQKMIQEINAGHAGELEGEYNSKKRRLARKMALKNKLQKGIMESRVENIEVGIKDSIDHVNVDEFSTPEDYLNSQMKAIFSDTLTNVAKTDYRKLDLYIEEYEKVPQKKKNFKQLEKDISDLKSVVNGSSKTSKAQ